MLWTCNQPVPKRFVQSGPGTRKICESKAQGGGGRCAVAKLPVMSTNPLVSVMAMVETFVGSRPAGNEKLAPPTVLVQKMAMDASVSWTRFDQTWTSKVPSV